MTVRLLRSPTSDIWSTSLASGINDSVTTISLTSTTNLQAPGVLVIDRTDGTNATPAKREFITFTGISGNDITGVTRGVAGSTAQSHNSGARVEASLAVSHWNDLGDYLLAEHDPAGKHVISTATITTHLMVSGASATFSDLKVMRFYSTSGASVTGNFPQYMVFNTIGALTGPTTSMEVKTAPRSGHIPWVNLLTRTTASGATAHVRLVRNNGITGNLFLAAGATFVSAATMGVKDWNVGDRIHTSYATTGGHIQDLLLMCRIE